MIEPWAVVLEGLALESKPSRLRAWQLGWMQNSDLACEILIFRYKNMKPLSDLTDEGEKGRSSL
jgi:hypothetical protein